MVSFLRAIFTAPLNLVQWVPNGVLVKTQGHNQGQGAGGGAGAERKRQGSGLRGTDCTAPYCTDQSAHRRRCIGASVDPRITSDLRDSSAATAEPSGVALSTLDCWLPTVGLVHTRPTVPITYAAHPSRSGAGGWLALHDISLGGIGWHWVALRWRPYETTDRGEGRGRRPKERGPSSRQPVRLPRLADCASAALRPLSWSDHRMRMRCLALARCTRAIPKCALAICAG